ncbi:siderophore-interacting protein [Asticcacaulis solisilvae]|uniref:siderophore-interacting protein n=1 Tax=Asticcacaulis solisilvae TaxID=1217274 RepID=UPI003FD7B1CE
MTDIPQPTRVRFEPKRRRLTVETVTDLTPTLRRMTLRGDMSGFQSLGFDDHIKLFLPDPETGVLTLPDPNGPHGQKSLMRDYTPRRFDVTEGSLTLDFALHGADGDAGPATHWALHARPGDELHVGGPRGSQVLSDAFDAYILIGDETALPAIGRRLEELPAGKRVVVLAEIATEAGRLDFETRASAEINWVVRGAGVLADAVARLDIPDNAHIWVAGEASQARQVREILMARGTDPRRIKASGYWRQGDAGTHEPIE